MIGTNTKSERLMDLEDNYGAHNYKCIPVVLGVAVSRLDFGTETRVGPTGLKLASNISPDK